MSCSSPANNLEIYFLANLQGEGLSSRRLNVMCIPGYHFNIWYSEKRGGNQRRLRILLVFIYICVIAVCISHTDVCRLM